MALSEVCDMLHAECSSVIAEVVPFFFHFFVFGKYVKSGDILGFQNKYVYLFELKLSFS